MILRPYQSDAVNALFAYFNSGNPGNPLIVMPTGCHAKGTLIMMHNGTVKPVEDIVVGDFLMGPDSKPRQVLSLARGNEPLWKIKPTKGDSFIVNEGHILSLATTNEGKNERWSGYKTGNEITNVTVREWLNWSKTKKHLHKLRRVPVDFPEQPNQKIPGWCMGVFLGDGSFGATVSVTTADFEIKEGLKILSEIFNIPMSIKMKNGDNKAVSIHFSQAQWTRSTENPIMREIRRLGLFEKKSQTKFVPNEYKFGKKDIRLEVLAGLIDTDGSLTNGNTFDFISKSKILADDVVFISRSLGLAAYCKPTNKKAQTGNGGEYYRVSISGNIEIIPTRIKRKQAHSRIQCKSVLKTGFNVELVGKGDFYGFSLDGDHLYLTSDFIVHHNTGKSVVIAAMIQRILTDYPTTRVLMATHVKELIQQNLEKLLRVWPDAPVGVYSAGLKQNNTEAPILFCGIQSVWNKAKALASESRPIELVFIDECHRVPLHANGTYRRFIDDLTRLNPHLRLIGLTATPYRHVPGTKTMTSGYQSLTVGDDRLFTDIAYDLTGALVTLIRQDYLSALWPQPTDYRVNLKGIRIENGDYKADQLNELMEREEVIDAILDEAIPLAQVDGRKHWLVFCAGVDAARFTAANLMTRGISAAVVAGDTSARDRDHFIREFRAGRLTALVSVGVLTTGFDAPVTDCLIIARPTLSPVLFVQMMGRGMRPTESKIAIEDARKRGCLVLDFCGNVDRHGPIDKLQLKGPVQKKRELTKTCPGCQAEISQFANPCPECGHEFEPAEKPPAEIPQAGKSAIIAGITPLAPPVRYKVSRVAYSRHVGKSGIPTLRVDYFSGFLRVASEWVCLEHTGYARQKAERWWMQRFSEHAWILPSEVNQEAINHAEKYLTTPTAIHVRTLPGKDAFPEIVKYEFSPGKELLA